MRQVSMMRWLAFGMCSAAVVLGASQNGMAAYRSRVLRDDPLGYWGLDEVSGAVAVNLGTLGPQADGTYFGASIQGDPGVGLADFNAAIRLGAGIGVSGVRADAPLLDNRSAFTLSGWINPELHEASSRAGLFGQNDAIEFGFIGPSLFQIWTPNGGSSEARYNLRNNEWHHVAVTGDSLTGELRLYVDGTLMELASTSARIADAFGASGFPFFIGGGDIFGQDTQYVGALDEVAVFDKALSAETIQQHFASAFGEPSILRINLSTGDVRIVGGDATAIRINGYEIASPQSVLRPERLLALGAQGLDEVDSAYDQDQTPGNSTGETWQVVYAASDAIIEGFLFGSTALDASVELSLGTIYDPSFGPDESLGFRYTLASGVTQQGVIEFVEGLPGDFDEDGDVDGLDLLRWQRNPAAGELADWEDYFGASIVRGPTIGSVVPEPTGTLGSALVVARLLAGTARGRRP